jgi:hypothetical protein
VPQGVAVDHCVLLWIHYHPFKAEQRAWAAMLRHVATCCDMLRNSSKISPFTKTTKWFERDPISWWQQPGGIWAICFTLWPQLRHCALCRFVQHELCESAWVMLMSLAEDRCDFNHLRDSHPQPGHFSDDTASAKSHENCLGFHSALELCLTSPLKYVRFLYIKKKCTDRRATMSAPEVYAMACVAANAVCVISTSSSKRSSLPMSWRVAAHWNRFYCSSVPIVLFHSFQPFGTSTFCPLNYYMFIPLF